MTELKIDELNIGSLKSEELNVKKLKVEELHTDLSHLDDLRVYDLSDKGTKLISAYASRQFSKTHDAIMSGFDELKVYKESKTLYEGLYKADKKLLLKIAKLQYRRFSKKKEPDLAWLLLYIDEVNELTKYNFKNELERKRDRFIENIIATHGKQKEFDRGRKYFVDMTKQYGDIICLEAMVKAFKDNGVKKVMWITEEDDRVCGECAPLHKKIYDINKIPSKKHWGCRCYVIPC